MQPLLLLAGVLILRDLLSLFLPGEAPLRSTVVSFGFTVSYAVLVFWSGRYRTTNRSFKTAIAAGLAATVLRVSFPGLAGTVEFVLPLVMVALTFVAFIRIDRYVLTAAVEVEGMRSTVQLMLIISVVALVVLPFADGSAQSVAGITATLPFWTVVLALLARSIESLRGEIRFQKRAAERIFAFLSDVGRSLGEGGEPGKIVAAAVDTIVGASGSDSGLGLIGSDGSYRVCAVKGVFPPPVPVPQLVKTKTGALKEFVLRLNVDQSTPLWGRALKTGEPILVPDATSSPYLRPHARDPILHLKSVIVLPLSIRGNVLGLITIARREASRPFNAADLARTESMANFVAVTLDNYYKYTQLVHTQRLERDIEIAGKIQNSFQAPADVQERYAEIAAISRPLRGVGGDYFDVVPMGGDRTAVIICDVAGKGVPAALVMMIIRTAARLALESTDDAGTVVEMINSAVSGSLEDDRFATVSVIVFDPRRERASFANAGHHPLVVMPAGENLSREADTDGLPVGVEPDARYESHTIPFPEQSWAVLYTDGVIEAVGAENEQYGIDRFRRSLERAVRVRGDRSARALLDELLETMHGFTGETSQQDDLTLVVIKSLSRDDPARGQ